MIKLLRNQIQNNHYYFDLKRLRNIYAPNLKATTKAIKIPTDSHKPTSNPRVSMGSPNSQLLPSNSFVAKASKEYLTGLIYWIHPIQTKNYFEFAKKPEKMIKATLISLNAHPAINPILLPFKQVRIVMNKCAITTPPSLELRPIIQQSVIRQKGISTKDFPMKYEKVVQSFEFSSLKNTSLSVENCNTTGNNELIVRLMQRKNIHPDMLVQSASVPEPFPISQYG